MLTIEELKDLNVGDWVWVVCCIAGTYATKTAQNDERLEYQTIIAQSYLDYADYGKTWLAYKNKEEAEGKSIALPYLLCTSSKFACVIWRDKDGKVKKTYTMPIDEAKGVLKEKERIQ